MSVLRCDVLPHALHCHPYNLLGLDIKADPLSSISPVSCSLNWWVSSVRWVRGMIQSVTVLTNLILIYFFSRSRTMYLEFSQVLRAAGAHTDLSQAERSNNLREARRYDHLGNLTNDLCFHKIIGHMHMQKISIMMNFWKIKENLQYKINW